jgi:hypothetical protein
MTHAMRLRTELRKDSTGTWTAVISRHVENCANRGFKSRKDAARWARAQILRIKNGQAK